MGPILPVSVAGARLPGGGGTITSPGSTTGTIQGTGVRLSSAGPASDIKPLMQIQAAVSQMLQSIGGGLEDDKILRMLIGLIILLALLRDAQDTPASPGNALASLSSGGQPQFVGSYSSSTTIMMQQTTTTIILHTADGYGAASDGAQSPSPGGGIDVTA